MIRIGIAEDNTVFRNTLSEALSLYGEFELVLNARNGKDAIHQLMQLTEPPEIMLMDIEMPGIDGIETTARFKHLAPDTKVIMLTIFDQDEQILLAIQNGASGYLLKGERPASIKNAIEQVLEGRLPMSPKVAGKALELIRGKSNNSHIPQDFNLTTRETEVLKLIAEACTYKDIAEQLFISEKTVRNHIHNIYQKLQVKSKAEAIKLAHQQKWFD